MDLAGKIRNDRVRKRRTRELGNRLFNVVANIVKTYGLKADFLELVETVGDRVERGTAASLRVRPKGDPEVPPYVLVSAEEYRLVCAVLARVDNPYLAFARSPEEILLSEALYARNPRLEPERLLSHDFETLLLREGAGEESAHMERRAGEAASDAEDGRGMSGGSGRSVSPDNDALRE